MERATRQTFISIDKRPKYVSLTRRNIIRIHFPITSSVSSTKGNGMFNSTSVSFYRKTKRDGMFNSSVTVCSIHSFHAVHVQYFHSSRACRKDPLNAEEQTAALILRWIRPFSDGKSVSGETKVIPSFRVSPSLIDAGEQHV